MREQDLDALVDDLFPILCIERQRRGDGFLFDPETLEGSTRHYYLEYLKWLGIGQQTLPPERVCIHGGLLHNGHPCPAKLELRSIPSGPTAGERFSVYLNNDLYRSIDAVKMALAHELTHLYLVLHGHQKLLNTATTADPGVPAVSHLSEAEEVRTDVASILLGFGRLVLNGACAYQRMCEKDGSVGQLGYLPVHSFAHVYRRVNDLVGVTADLAAHGLNDLARKAMAAAPR